MNRNKRIGLVAAVLVLGLPLIAYWVLISANTRLPVPKIEKYAEQSNAHIQKLQEARKLQQNRSAFAPDFDNRMDKYSVLQEAQLRPIDFYAQVTNQYGDPVANAEVSFGVGGVWGAPGTGRGNTKTDENGMFNLEGARGSSVSIHNFKKNGYVFNRAVGESSVNRHVFDSYKRFHDSVLWSQFTRDKPYPFLMWKIEQHANINAGERHYYFTLDRSYFSLGGESHDVNLNGQSKSNYTPPDQSHFRVSFVRANREWRLTLTANGGGFLEVPQNQLYMNSPPEIGYQETVIIEGQESSQSSNRYEKKYYLKTENSLFASLQLEIRPYFGDDSFIKIKYAINMDGTRYLATNTH